VVFIGGESLLKRVRDDNKKRKKKQKKGLGRSPFFFFFIKTRWEFMQASGNIKRIRKKKTKKKSVEKKGEKRRRKVAHVILAICLFNLLLV
jgi:hypothetical protein